ncbi:hypothetical protein [Streptomyces murinus]|uniref:hypothetical protein n=1 Tax=Streptomyces murinus TaxID=33900 RepID=UPI0018F6EA80|nr:hypothetical protein [Streptomyces murinus]
MSKSSGLGDNLYIAGFDASGDISALGNIGGGPAALDFTAINKSAMERKGGVRDGRIEYTAFFNHVDAGTGTHEVLSALPTSDQIITYCRGTQLGSPAACLVSKQIGYDGTRGTDGTFTFAVSSQANGFGLEWGQQLTPGLRTDTAATLGTSIDTTAAASFGAQAYLQVTAFTGTDATIKVQDSADNSTFADVAGLTFTQVTAAPTTQRIATASGATIRRYLRVTTTTTGGFTALTFNVVVVKNQTAVVF